MLKFLLVALRMTAVTVVLLGFLYPLLIMGIAHLAFPAQSSGSFVRVGGRIVGSRIIGERWTQARYFHGRPSAAGSAGYDPLSTGASNLGPDSKKLIARVVARIATLRKDNPRAPGMPPIGLLTASGSGIDPDISPSDARYQAERIAAARAIPLRRVLAVITAHTKPRTFGFLGEPRANVLALNLALDRVNGASTR